MLVLVRKPGERIIIEGEQGQIVVTVVAIAEGRVRLGLAAPTHIPIRRAELGSGPPGAVAPRPLAAAVTDPGAGATTSAVSGTPGGVAASAPSAAPHR